MEVDGSFAEYVAARWSMLHRLATLLVGPDGADELVRAALVRAYVSWRELHDPASVDQSVKGILAREAARTGAPAAPPFDTGQHGSTGDEVWERFRALAPRQRALLVLRHHEGFSDADIADALACSRKAVAADALALERGFDVGELREELRRRSDAAVVPHPPLDAILAAGRAETRRRRTRSWRWGAVAAGGPTAVLLLANVGGGTTGGPEERPRSPDPPRVQSFASLPDGEPPRIAYALGRSLHLASGTVVHLGSVPTGIVQTKRWLYAAYLSGEVVRIDPATGDTQVAATSSRGELATDPAGEHLTWLSGSEGSAEVVLRTVWDGAVALSDEQEFPARPNAATTPS
jgi:DNA-directed RNA polymerase specialized sigma24 family protein